MMTSKTRLAIVGSALVLAAVITSPVLAGSRGARTQHVGDHSAEAVQLARGVVGSKQADVYAPTGEIVDLTVNVVASRLSR
jgi:hypothetical protein